MLLGAIGKEPDFADAVVVVHLDVFTLAQLSIGINCLEYDLLLMDCLKRYV